MSGRSTLRVALGARAYDVHVGAGLIGEAGRFLTPFAGGRPAIVVTDGDVAPLYLDPLRAALEEAGVAQAHIVLPPGETTKEFPTLRSLIEDILDLRPERGSMLIALGGGVVGDIAGFAASVVLRGIGVVQMPTTLLAQVDSAVGGKTAINTRHGKNMVGSFHQPLLVLADIAALRSLDRRQLRAGYAEVVKYGLIDRPDFFAWLEANGRRALDGEDDALERAVVVSCRSKAAIVAGDERESGRRALLNLGHTFAHALEAETGYGGELIHGEAVAIGLVLAFRLSAALGLCPQDDARRVERHVAAAGLPTGLGGLGPRRWDAAALIEHMRTDKKVRDGRLRFVLARGIGRAFVCDDVDPARLASVLEASIAG